MKRLAMFLAVAAGCGQMTAEPKATSNAEDELHWLGEQWTDPHVYSNGTLLIYRRSEWPGVQVMVKRNAPDDYMINTQCWENSTQEWVFHGPALSVGPTDTTSFLYEHSDSSDTGIVRVPWTDEPIRIDDPDDYDLTEPSD